jgi:signal peptidase
MRSFARITTIVVIAAAAVLAAFQLFDAPAKYVIVSGHSMEPTLHTGDVAFVIRHASYRRGDVVAYRVPDGQPGAGGIVIHRVIGGSNAAGYVTRGDNRAEHDIWRPKPGDVIGSMALQIPLAGRLPAFLRTPLGLGICAGLLAFLLVTGTRKRKPQERPPAPPVLTAPPQRRARVSPATVGPSDPASGPDPPGLVVAVAGLAVGGLVLIAARAAQSRHAVR